MDEELLDFTNLLILKNHLGMHTRSEIVKLYEDMDDYINFIDIFVFLTETDSGFLLLDSDFLEKVLTVLQIHRFDVEDASIKEIINSIIDYVNRIKSMGEDAKNVIKNSYLAYHEELREATFHDNDSFILSLCYDAIVLKAICDGDLEICLEHKLTLMSLNYLMKVCPDFFKDEAIKANALALLDNCMRGNKMFDGCKRHAKMLKLRLNSDFSEE